MRLQRNLILSHTAGVGEPLPDAVVRAMIVLRVNTLLQGHSGIRLETLQALCALIEASVHPIVPRHGSVGASGDLAPLAHMAAVLLGAGRARIGGRVLPGSEALSAAGLEPVKLGYKEGLALINGTTLMAALAVLTLDHVERALESADVTGAMSLEALCGRRDAFDPAVHALRPHPGQARVAENLLNLTEGSSLLDIPYADVPDAHGAWSTDERGVPLGGKPRKPQDAYAFRCMPQVHGAVRDAARYAAAVVDRELNSVTDNPLLFPETGRVLSAGNFHGMPLALALASLKCALPPLAAVAERRIAALVDDATSDGLPRFLVPDPKGVDSGVMLLQYSAASLVNAMATAAHPASVYSVPTCANTEDHVSMGANEGLDALQMARQLEQVLAMELVVAGQALDARLRLLDGSLRPWSSGDAQLARHAARVRAADHRPGRAITAVHAALRERVPFIVEDGAHELSTFVADACTLQASGDLVRTAESVCGPLK